MAWTSGTVLDFASLLSTVVDYITGDALTVGRDWCTLSVQNTKDNVGGEPFGSDCKEYIVKNTGISGSESIIIGIREWKYVVGGAYGWDLNCYTSWDGGTWNVNTGSHGQTTYNDTWERWTNHPHVPLLDGSMDYWIFSNSQRVIVIVKTGAYYQSCYLGYGYRLGTPSEYSYPTMAIGSMYGNGLYSDETNYHHYFAKPYIYGVGNELGSDGCAAFVCGTDNLFSSIVSSYGNLRFIPSHGDMFGTSTLLLYYEFLDEPSANLNGDIMMNPIYVKMNGDVLCCLDGVVHTPNASLSSEDTIDDGTDEWLVVPDVYRTTYTDFIAIRKD